MFNAKKGQLTDYNNLIYDITSRKWTAAHYAMKFYADTDIVATKDLIAQTLALK